MRRMDSRVVFGILLVLVGLLLLLQNLNVIPLAWDLFWAFLFVASGLAFLGVFVERPERWWPLIPGFTLLALGALIALGATAPWAARTWGGSLFLGGIGLGFWMIYLVRPANWWAIIPGGVLITLALVAGLSQAIPGSATGGIFFMGLGLTFALVYLLPKPQGRQSWALIPAAVLVLMGLFTFAATSPAINYLWPLLLILAGIYLLYRSQRSRGA